MLNGEEIPSSPSSSLSPEGPGLKRSISYDADPSNPPTLHDMCRIEAGRGWTLPASRSNSLNLSLKSQEWGDAGHTEPQGTRSQQLPPLRGAGVLDDGVQSSGSQSEPQLGEGVVKRSEDAEAHSSCAAAEAPRVGEDAEARDIEDSAARSSAKVDPGP